MLSKKNSIPGCEFILLCFLLEVLAFKFRPNIHFELSFVYNTRQGKLFVVNLDFYYFKEKFPICIIIKSFLDIKKNFLGCCAVLSWASLVVHLVKNVFLDIKKNFLA